MPFEVKWSLSNDFSSHWIGPLRVRWTNHAGKSVCFLVVFQIHHTPKKMCCPPVWIVLWYPLLQSAPHLHLCRALQLNPAKWGTLGSDVWKCPTKKKKLNWSNIPNQELAQKWQPRYLAKRLLFWVCTAHLLHVKHHHWELKGDTGPVRVLAGKSEGLFQDQQLLDQQVSGIHTN